MISFWVITAGAAGTVLVLMLAMVKIRVTAGYWLAGAARCIDDRELITYGVWA